MTNLGMGVTFKGLSRRRGRREAFERAFERAFGGSERLCANRRGEPAAVQRAVLRESPFVVVKPGFSSGLY